MTTRERALAFARSRLVRTAFLAAAFGAAGWAVASRADEVAEALEAVGWAAVVPASLAAVAFVVCTMLAWRVLMVAAGSWLSPMEAARLFFPTQLGKYLPGGVWNVVALAEVGADRGVARRASVSVMVVFWLVSLSTALTLAIASLGVAAFGVTAWWVWFALPPLLLLMHPSVLNSVITAVLARVNRPPLPRALTVRGMSVAWLWSVAGWAFAGVQLWLVVVPLGMPATWQTLVLCVGGYAVAWAAGFLFIIAPAGVGVREAVLAGVLAGHLGPGAVIVAVLLSRVLTTTADVALAVAMSTGGGGHPSSEGDGG